MIRCFNHNHNGVRDRSGDSEDAVPVSAYG